MTKYKVEEGKLVKVEEDNPLNKNINILLAQITNVKDLLDDYVESLAKKDYAKANKAIDLLKAKLKMGIQKGLNDCTKIVTSESSALSNLRALN